MKGSGRKWEELKRRGKKESGKNSKGEGRRRGGERTEGEGGQDKRRKEKTKGEGRRGGGRTKGEERRRGEKERRREGERGSLEIVHELLRGVGQLTLDDWFNIRLDKGLGILLALDEVLHCHCCLYLLVYISHDLTIDLNPVLFYKLRSQST